MARLGEQTGPAESASINPATPGVDNSGVWLNGDVISCSCPDCQAPIPIRLWLMVADCFHCGTSVELTEEQEQAALRLAALREQATKPALKPAPKPVPRPAPKTVAKAAPAAPSQPAVPATPTPPRPAWRPAPSPAPPPPIPVAVPVVSPLATIAAWVHDAFRDLPAWIISLLVHVVLIILLGMLTYESPDKREPVIILAASMGDSEKEGGRRDERETALVELDDPGEEQTPDVPKPEEQQAVSDAAELQASPDQPSGTLPDLEKVRETIARPGAQRKGIEGRDPRLRGEVVQQEGGSVYTEQAVAQGLRWIIGHQHDDGHWSLDNFHHAGACNGRCSGAGQNSDTAATSLALLPLLGAGQTHMQGIYQDNVARGLQWLIRNQKPDGDLRGDGIGRMYAHGQAAIVLCEAFALTGDEQLRPAAQRAIDFIVFAQHSGGGWRYEPKQGDVSVVGWQLMALQSAKMAYLDVPESTLERAGQFLDRMQSGDFGGLYGYHPYERKAPSPAMTAEGLLCRQYLGWPRDHRGLEEGTQYLMEESLPSLDSPNIYCWYYATQVMHHVGGERWATWNTAMREVLLNSRETEGHAKGSWAPRGGALSGDHDTRTGGRLYMTSLAICTLEVYYRHLPLYRGLELDAVETASRE